MDSRQTTLTMANGLALEVCGQQMAADPRPWVSRRAGKVTLAGKATVAYVNGGSCAEAIGALRGAHYELSTHGDLPRVPAAADALETLNKVLEAIAEA